MVIAAPSNASICKRLKRLRKDAIKAKLTGYAVILAYLEDTFQLTKANPDEFNALHDFVKDRVIKSFDKAVQK